MVSNAGKVCNEECDNCQFLKHVVVTGKIFNTARFWKVLKLIAEYFLFLSKKELVILARKSALNTNFKSLYIIEEVPDIGAGSI